MQIMRSSLLVLASLALFAATSPAPLAGPIPEPGHPEPSPASAQGQSTGPVLAQLRIDGELKRLGAFAWIEIAAMARGQVKVFNREVFLGPGSTGLDLMTWISKQLDGLGIDATLTGEGAEGPGASLFIEGVLHIHTQLRGGLTSAISSSLVPPSAVRIYSTSPTEPAAQVYISASTFSPHAGIFGQADVAITLDPADWAGQAGYWAPYPIGNAPKVSEKLLAATQALNWHVDRPRGDAWRPIRLRDGSFFKGMSVFLESPGEWRLEVDFINR